MPEFKTHNLWPIPVYEDDIPLKSEWKTHIENIEYRRTHVNNSDISVNRYLLNELPDLKNEIENHCENFVRRYLKVKKNIQFTLQNSWSNIHHPNDEAQSHYHGNSLLSGVYYTHTPKNCGGIVFHKNSIYTNLFHQSIRFEYDEDNHLNAEGYVVNVREGMIVLFPSHLSHSVQKNLSNEPRYSLAFNFFIKGKLGKEEYTLEVK